MYIGTSSKNHGENNFCSFRRTESIQTTKITFFYNRFPFLNNGSIKPMGPFRVQFLLKDNTWNSRYNISKNDQYSNLSTHWTIVILIFLSKTKMKKSSRLTSKRAVFAQKFNTTIGNLL